jgi:hypothetical protein
MFRIPQFSTCVLVAGAFLCVSPAGASSISRQGIFTSDDNIVVIGFSLLSPDTVILQTLSFSGGAGVSGSVASGGFSPVLSLFDSNGDLLAVDAGGSVPNCGSRNIDPESGYCLDAYINIPLDAGNYSAALTQDDNTPLGDFSAGFQRQDTGNFTAADLGLYQGSFLLFDGSQRSSSWEVEFLGVDSSNEAPEPSTTAAAVLGLGFLFLTHRFCGNRASDQAPMVR